MGQEDVLKSHGQERFRPHPHFPSAAQITQLSPDPDRGIAGRCVQGMIDVLEENYAGDISKIRYVVHQEAFR